MNKCTVVMYHYVRDLQHSFYPEIKALETHLFVQQLEFLKKHYQFIRGEDLIHAIQGKATLPDRAVLLTFDDGYLDHYINVFPVLDRMGLSGVFFPPVDCVVNKKVLDVNKLHYILASVPDKMKLVSLIHDDLVKYRDEYTLRSEQEYRALLWAPSRFDPAEVIYIKRMLQRELPESLRHRIVDSLFRDFVSEDEAAFASTLYMNEEQIQHMARSGMMIGGHGSQHYWMDRLDSREMDVEISETCQFLDRVAVDTRAWFMCYPYGAHNTLLREKLRQAGCVAAVTTEVGVADLAGHGALTLPRLDTNDLPKHQDAEKNSWWHEG